MRTDADKTTMVRILGTLVSPTSGSTVGAGVPGGAGWRGGDPAVVFLDEPASGLDPVAAHEVHGLVAGLRDLGVTVFLTTHRLEVAG
jgi:ABC-type multidrug transport system ATPase subunit